MDQSSSNPLNLELPSNQVEKAKKPRRKHKNSKLGCVQCKERRMKCNEELPECRNCTIRLVKVPCSYLKFTEQEKKDFIKKKASFAKEQDISSQVTPSPSCSPSSQKPIANSYQLNLVKHVRSSFLKSQNQPFLIESSTSFKGRLYLTKMINDSFFRDDDSNSLLTLASFWLTYKFKQKLDLLKESDDVDEDDITELSDKVDSLFKFGLKFKSEALVQLRLAVFSIIEDQNKNEIKRAIKTYASITIPTYSLQCSDLLAQESLKNYYINGSLTVLNELYKSTEDSSPLANFVAVSFLKTQKSIFIPNYSFEVLYEIYDEVLSLEPFILESNNELLIFHYHELVKFIDVELINSSLQKTYDPRNVMPYPADLLYSILNKYHRILPSESFSISFLKTPIERVFYSFYHSLGRALDNVFPEPRYLAYYRFVGPTTLYPFTTKEILQDVPTHLQNFAKFSTRLLSFFARRAEFFTEHLKVLTPFPENVADNRFSSRKAKIDEVIIKSFRTTSIKPYHYPQMKNSNGEFSDSPDSNGSFSHNFNALFALKLDFSSKFPSNINGHTNDDYDHGLINDNDGLLDNFDDTINSNDYEIDVKSGLFACDYDPISQDIWVNEPIKGIEASPMSLKRALEDRNVLINSFIK